MARKPTKKKTAKKSKKAIIRKDRAYQAALERIAAQDNIPVSVAKKRYRNALLELLIHRPTMSVVRSFIEIKRGKFREIPAGKPLKEQYAVGPIRTLRYVKQVIAQKKYWELVNILAAEYDVPVAEMRKRIKKRIETGESVQNITYETAKFEFQSEARRTKKEARRMLGRPKGSEDHFMKKERFS